MINSWSFGRKLAMGFGLAVLLTFLVSAISLVAVRRVVAEQAHVLDTSVEHLLVAERIKTVVEQRSSAVRGFLLTGQDNYSADVERINAAFEALVATLRRQSTAPELVMAIAQSDDEYRVAIRSVIEQRRTSASVEEVERAFVTRVIPLRTRLATHCEAFAAHEQNELRASLQTAHETSSLASGVVLALTLLSALVAIALAVSLARSLTRQIAKSVGQVQSSSTELHAAASQQASSSREQASAMAEISTTIRELLATSKQIAESSQRVSNMAAQTASSSIQGNEVVARAHAAIQAIGRQVEQIVEHMLELGRKSQQIGSVLDIVSELSEQTNILAINATIEAVAGGENSRRFGVVAEEIRKLADRMGTSTKEIRALIEDVRGAVNTTVMATETGAKTADAGAREFSVVSDQFTRIMALVGTMTEAAKEIELSTKQQATAVEQVNAAIAGVAQATREAETSSVQTSQTATQLRELSRELMGFVQPRAA